MSFPSKPNVSNIIFTWFAMVSPIVFCISKTPTITWVGSQKLLESWHHSKCVIPNARHPKIKRGYACNTKNKSWENIFLLGFCHNFGRTSFISCLWNGNWTHSHWWRTKCLNHGFSTYDKGWYSLAMYGIKSSKKYVCVEFDFA